MPLTSSPPFFPPAPPCPRSIRKSLGLNRASPRSHSINPDRIDWLLERLDRTLKFAIGEEGGGITLDDIVNYDEVPLLLPHSPVDVNSNSSLPLTVCRC